MTWEFKCDRLEQTIPDKPKRILMNEIIEEIFTGYCKSHNSTQTIICEYEQLPCGLSLDHVSCDYMKCSYNKDCQVIRQALAKEDE